MSDPSVLPANPGHGQVKLFVGGSQTCSAENCDRADNTTEVVLDVANEVEQLALPRETFVFPLAVGETSKTLTQAASGEVRAAVDRHPGTDMRLGLSQYRVMGWLAVRLAAWYGAFGAFLAERLIPYLSRRHPVLSHVTVVGKCGLAGGTGSAGGVEALLATAQTLLARTAATVHLFLDAIGARSTLSLTKRGARNCAVGIVDALSFAVALWHPRQTCRVTFRELPDVGIDRAEREVFTVEAEQALSASEVQSELAKRAPNYGFDGRFGNCQIVETHFFHRLDARQEVAPDVAVPLVEELQQLSRTPRDPRIDEITVAAELVPEPREPIDSLALRAPHTSAEEIFQGALQRPGQFRTSIAATLIDGAVVNLNDPATEFASPPLSPDASRERLGLQKDCLFHLENLLAEAEIELAEAQQEGKEVQRELLLVLSVVQGHPSLSVRAWIQYLFRGAAARLRAVEESLDLARANHDRQMELAAKLAAILTALQGVDAELRWHLRKLLGMTRELIKHVPRRRRFTARLVEARPLGWIFPDLWEAEGQVADDKIVKLLMRAVWRVTIDGLARIVRAAEARPEQIAQRLLESKYAVIGPAWAGIDRRDTPLRFQVLPPTAPDVADEIRRLVKGKDANRFIAVADWAPASQTIVGLDFYAVRRLRDALGGIYTAELEAALLDPNSALYGVDREKLAALGIRVEAQKITFSDDEEELA